MIMMIKSCTASLHGDGCNTWQQALPVHHDASNRQEKHAPTYLQQRGVHVVQHAAAANQLEHAAGI
jgi:hypothetical protein